MDNIIIKEIDHQLTWPIRHEVMYPNLPLDVIKLPHEEAGLHFGVFVNGNLTSVISLFWEGKVYQFRKFATLANAQGCGYGSALLRHVIQYSKDQGAETLWCNGRLTALGFYKKFGFEQSGEVFTKKQIDFVKMQLNALNTR